MTDNEIIKALECCMNGHCDDDCPFGETKEHCYNLDSLTLDLINRQKEEIERLKARCENTQIGYNFAKDEIKDLKKDKYKLKKALNQSEDYRVIAKAEAYKEVAERLKEYINRNEAQTAFFGRKCFISEEAVDNLVKELVGEET